MSTQLRIRERIAPTGQTMTWRQGFEAMKPKGGMPSHVLLDTHLCDKDYRASLSPEEKKRISRACFLMSHDLGAHPAKGEKFRRGRDIYNSDTNFYLPWSELARHLPPSELVRRKIMLLVTPKDIIDACLGDKRISIVHTENILIVHPTVEAFGAQGEIDKYTGLVLAVPSTRLMGLSKAKKRKLFRRDEESCGLLWRNCGGGTYIGSGVFVHRHDIVLGLPPRSSSRFGVAGVVYDVLDENGKVIATSDTKPQLPAAQFQEVRA